MYSTTNIRIQTLIEDFNIRHHTKQYTQWPLWVL